jgi:alanine-glyoxylate transaminase / serine-glyoxylate transaminase / serine-pyruvate transaminase
MVAPRVYEAMAKPIVGHLDPYFFSVFADIQTLLRMAFGTENPLTLPISGTGTAGMETAVANFVEPGMKVVVLSNGYFCERIADMALRHGGKVAKLDKPWGEVFGQDEMAEFVHREKPDIVAFVQAETSTGAYQPGKAIADAAHDMGALVIADCVTSLGGMPVRVDANGIDIAYSCSQKGLSCPPGLAPVTVSPRAFERLKSRKTRVQGFYFDLRLLEEYFHAPHRYHHTASATLFYALREGLALVAEEGLEERWSRHRTNHQAFVAGIEAMGLSMQVEQQSNRLWTLNTPKLPEGVSDLKIRQHLMQEHSIEILGGFGPLAGKVLRIGLMGVSSTRENVLLVLEALEQALRQEGFGVKESGKAAAEAFYATSAAGTSA